MSDLIERANRKYGVEFLHGGVATFDVRIKHPIVADLLAELARLTDEVERLRADAGRLDWMDEHSRRTSEIKGRPADDGDGSCSVWFVVGEPGQTLRATLDAAIKEVGNGS